jgi:EmrB/QacA subfamily drug resistance transporter
MTSISTGTQRNGRRLAAPWMVLALVCASQFIVILDASIVNVALPSIQRDLGFTAVGLAWVVNGYLLTFAGFMLLGGRAADVLGRRQVLVAGLFLFSAASLAAGLATDPGVLVMARVVQGVGAAMLAPATLAVINTSFTEPQDRARAFGTWSAAGGVGGMAGTVAGGAITSGLSWRWVFLINVPIGGLLILAAVLSLPGIRAARRHSFDLAGAISGTAGLGAVIYGVMQSAEHGWTSVRVAGPAGTGLLLLVGFVLVERAASRPMVPPAFFRIRRVAVSNALLLLFGAIAIAMWYFTSLFMQNVLDYSAFRSGLGQTPAAVTFVVIARVASALLPRTGVRPLVLAGCAGFLAGFAWLAHAQTGSGYLTSVLGPTLLVATGIGLTFPTLMSAATADAPDNDMGIIGGLANTANQVGGSVGLAVLATAAGARASAHAADTADALAAGYQLVFLAAAGLGVVIALVSLLLPSASDRPTGIS